MHRSCPAQRPPWEGAAKWLRMGWRSPCAEQGGSGISAGRVPWSRREEEKKLLGTAKLPPLHTASQRTTSHLSLSCRSMRRGKEGEKEKAREPCLPATPSIPLFFQHEQAARVPRWQGSRCLGANCALFVCRARHPLLAAGWGHGEVSSGDPMATPGTARRDAGPCLRIAHVAAAGAELAAMHQQPHSSALPATYIGASRQERLLSPSKQHGPTDFLEAFQAASLQATLCAPLAPRRGVGMNGRKLESSCHQHAGLGTAPGGCEAHAKPRGSGQVCLTLSPLPCSLLAVSPWLAEFHKQGPSPRSGSFSPWSCWPRGAGGCCPCLCRG